MSIQESDVHAADAGFVRIRVPQSENGKGFDYPDPQVLRLLGETGADRVREILEVVNVMASQSDYPNLTLKRTAQKRLRKITHLLGVLAGIVQLQIRTGIEVEEFDFEAMHPKFVAYPLKGGQVEAQIAELDKEFYAALGVRLVAQEPAPDIVRTETTEMAVTR